MTFYVFLFFYQDPAISQEVNEKNNTVDANLKNNDEGDNRGQHNRPAKVISPGNF